MNNVFISENEAASACVTVSKYFAQEIYITLCGIRLLT